MQKVVRSSTHFLSRTQVNLYSNRVEIDRLMEISNRNYHRAPKKTKTKEGNMSSDTVQFLHNLPPDPSMNMEERVSLMHTKVDTVDIAQISGR